MKVFAGERQILGNVRRASDPLMRLKGLMFDVDMAGRDGLLIPGCNWIHTFFMRFPIDVIYLNKGYEVVDLDVNVMPWRMCSPRLKACHVLELKAGVLEKSKVSIGEVLRCIG